MNSSEDSNAASLNSNSSGNSNISTRCSSCSCRLYAKDYLRGYSTGSKPVFRAKESYIS